MGKIVKKTASIPPQKEACSKPSEKASCCTEGAKKTAPKPSVKKTIVKVKFDCGFPNTLFIRGEGISSLSWSKGTQMKNLSKNEWMWECCRPCSRVEFKVLINDQLYEAGDNHTVSYGDELTITPKF